MNNPLYEISERFAKEESKWIDEAIKELVPMWKLNLLLKINTVFLRKILGVNIQIIKEDLIDELGSRIIIRNNNKYIACKFKGNIHE